MCLYTEAPPFFQRATEEIFLATAKPRRADAARNREKLLKATTELVGQGGELSLAMVAERAGVGIGTLYRHFPNRDALLAALYRTEVERLSAEAAELARQLPPLEALAAWMERYAGVMTVKYGLAGAMQSALRSDSGATLTDTKALLMAALGSLLSAAAEAGAIRSDARPQDLLMAMSATVSASLGAEDGAEKRKRVMALILNGLRFDAGN